MSGILAVLTPAESKRLIAKGLVQHPAVRRVREKGRMIISNGSTTGFFLQELLDPTLDISRFACGVVTKGVACVTPESRLRSVLLCDGVPEADEPDEQARRRRFIAQMGAGDLFIKGANAIDPDGNAGFLLAAPDGGILLDVMPKVMAQHVHMLLPTGLEKMIASVPEAQRQMRGIFEYDYTFGLGCGYVSFCHGEVFHELSALQLLTGVTGTHVASGGLGGSEGAVTLVLDGTPEQLRAAAVLLEQIKNEPSTPAWKQSCGDCRFRCKHVFERATSG